MNSNLLQSFVDKGTIEEEDRLLAKELLTFANTDEENQAALAAAVVNSSRKGHLCLEMDPLSLKKLYPSDPDFILLILEAVSHPDPKLVSSNEKEVAPLFLKDKRLYLHKYFLFEKKILSALELLKKKTKPFLLKNPEDVPLTLEQKKALEIALSHRATFLTGGPGTGKTYTAFYIAKALYDSLSGEAKKQFSLILTAPTGKATERLKRSFDFFFKEGVRVTVATLHKLLQIRKQKKASSLNFFHADLILVDESSMIDAEIFALFLEALSTKGHVVFMGDPHQLPSVGSGSVFSDLLTLSQHTSDLGVAKLTHCLRVESEEILQLSSAIHLSETDKVEHILAGPCERVKKIDLGFSTPFGVVSKLAHHCDALFPYAVNEPFNPPLLLEAMQKVKILSCLKKGPHGVDAINAFLMRYFLKKASGSDYFIAPIILHESDKDLELSNGQEGMIAFSLKTSLSPIAFFQDLATKEIRSFSSFLLPKYDYAYCLSVHKAQGSEFDHVIFLAPKGSEFFGKEVLYTALTRAKKKLELDIDSSILSAVLQESSQRKSGITKELILS